MSDRLSVGVFFGGRSVEHEVSVVTAMQVFAAMPEDRFHAVPVYIAKSGAWYTGAAMHELAGYRDVDRLLASATRVSLRPEPDGGSALVEVAPRRGLLGGGARTVARLDVALPLVHGTHGEDGTLQGLFELCDLAYAGPDVAAASISMDKRRAKAVLRGAGLPVLDDIPVERSRWEADAQVVRADVVHAFAPPLFVKPLSLGSSIGVTRVVTDSELQDALDLALTYDRACVVEPAQEGITEINCAVLGCGDAVRTSVCEQPVASGPLSYADKYLSKGATKDAAPRGMKGAQRRIPAPIPEPLVHRLQDGAAAAFRAIGAAGVARVDFLVRPENDWWVVNEVNTVPGSLAFYLWEPVGLAFPELIAELIDIGVRRNAEKRRTTFSIDTWLLRGRPGA